jgi:hypothetical protein
MTQDVAKWLARIAIIGWRDQIATLMSRLADRADRYGEPNHITLADTPREHRY